MFFSWKYLLFKPSIDAIHMIYMAASCDNDIVIVLFQSLQANRTFARNKYFFGESHRVHSMNVSQRMPDILILTVLYTCLVLASPYHVL